MRDLMEILKKAIGMKASDVHITVGRPPMVRLFGNLEPYDSKPLTNAEIDKMVDSILTDNQKQFYTNNGEIDFSYGIPDYARLRINVFKQRRSNAIAIRLIQFDIPDFDSLALPSSLKDLASKQRGLVLVTGPTGSGKSTTLAAMINHINSTRNCHIITLEEPIEYLHKHGKALINQREIGDDSKSFAAALRAALREDPDVILVGEMRDLETMSTAISASETGHLVLSTLHTIGSAQTIDRIIDVFPPNQQFQIRVQLADVIQGIISQQLIKRVDETGRVAALEILLANDAVRNLIRENKGNQINSILQTHVTAGMISMDMYLAKLVKENVIDFNEALVRCVDKAMFKRYLA